MSDLLTQAEQTIGGNIVIEPPVTTTIVATTSAGSNVVFTLDANVNETEELESDVSQYAVEDGSPMSDNIALKSSQVSVDGTVTNMSTDYIGSTGLVGKAKFTLAKSILKGLYAARQTVTLITGLDVYADYAIKNIRITRTAPKGQLDISIRLIKIRKVTLQVVASNFAPGATSGKGGATKAKSTNQNDSADTTKATQGTTILGGLASKLKSLF
jgi:hypothetical protein